MTREAIIYGIRCVGSEAIVYVGQTVDLKQRPLSGYARRVSEWMLEHEWEYVVLDSVPLIHATDRERYHVERLQSEGVELFNINKPCRSTAREMKTSVAIAFRADSRAQIEDWKVAAKAEQRNLSDWIRVTLDARARAVGRRQGGANG